MMCAKRGLPISCPIMFTTLVHKVTSLYPFNKPQYFLIIMSKWLVYPNMYNYALPKVAHAADIGADGL